MDIFSGVKPTREYRSITTNRGCFILWFLCVLCGHVWCGISGHALDAKASKVVVLKMCICLQGTP